MAEAFAIGGLWRGGQGCYIQFMFRTAADMSELTHTAIIMNRLQAQVEAEKAALARKIHDELGGFLIASAMDITTLRRRFAAHDPDALSKFDRLAHMLNGAIDLMRRVTEELHPTLLDNVGLFAALRWYISHMAHRSSVTCTVTLPDVEPKFHPDAAITLFRVGQEALYVAESQSDITAVDLSMEVDAESLSMRVIADGVPTPPAADTSGGIAWRVLQYRISGLRGAATMSHPSGGGICLQTRVPLGGALLV